MKGYKVVLNTQYGLRSVLDAGKDDSSLVYYTPRVKAYPQPDCGPLYVFTELEAAVDFSRPQGGTSIYTCEYERSECDCGWYVDQYGDRISSWGSVSPGADLADSVTLLEEVVE